MILIAVLTVLRVDGAEAGGNARHQHRQGQQQRRRRRDPPPRGLLHPACCQSRRRRATRCTLEHPLLSAMTLLSSLSLYISISISRSLSWKLARLGNGGRELCPAGRNLY